MVETVVTVEHTQTTQTTSPGGGVSAIRINPDYYRTIPGWIKLAQFIIGIICMACASPAYIGATSFFLFVVVVSFIATILWIFAYLLGIREALNVAVNWIFSELINTGICCVFYFIASIVQLAAWSAHPGFNPVYNTYGSNIAAGVFGIFNTIAYGAGTYFLFLQHRGGATL